MDKNDIAFCGLDCDLCRKRFSDIRNKAMDLNKSLEDVNFKEIAKVIPFMKSPYKGYQKMLKFFGTECPGCRNKGGNPFCAIRKCATKKGYFTCAECETLCKKFKVLFKVHTDNEVQNNIKEIQEKGIDGFAQSR